MRPFEKGIAVAIAFVPIATAWIAGRYADASAHREANVRLVEVAVGVLQQPLSPSTRVMRVWAAAVVDKYSEVPLGDAARKALTDSIVLPASGSFSFPWDAAHVRILDNSLGRDTNTIRVR
jgi:hypothetical protein